MEIVVCVKRVAATDSAIKIGADGMSIDPAGVEFELNAYDEFAMEQALQFVQQAGSGSVTVITLGPTEAQKELRTCLAMGADRAILLETSAWVHDSWSTANALAETINTLPFDLVLMGKQAVDADNNQLPPRLAQLLDRPSITEVAKLSLADGVLTAERDIEGAREVITCPLPAVVSCNKGLNEPRYANLKGIMAAKRKPLDKIPAPALEPALQIVSLALPPGRPAGRILGEGSAAVPALIEALKNEVKVL